MCHVSEREYMLAHLESLVKDIFFNFLWSDE